MSYQDLFDSVVNTVENTDYSSYSKLFNDTLEAALPEAQLIKEGYNYLEPKVGPTINKIATPVEQAVNKTGLGNTPLIGLGKIPSLGMAGDPTLSQGAGLVDMALPGLVAAGVDALPKIDITPKMAPEVPSLPRPYDIETTAEPTVPQDYKDIFNKTVHAEDQPAPIMEEKGVENAPTIEELKSQIAPTSAASETPATSKPIELPTADEQRQEALDWGKDVGLIKGKEPFAKLAPSGALTDTIESDKPDNPPMAFRYAYREPQIIDENGELVNTKTLPDDVVNPKADKFWFTEGPYKNSQMSIEDIKNQFGYNLMPEAQKLVQIAKNKPSILSSESGQLGISPVDVQQKVSEQFDISGQYNPITAAKAERAGDIEANNFEDSRTIKDIIQGLKDTEKQALMYRESGKVPDKIKNTPEGQAIQQALTNPTPALQEANKKLDAFTDNAYNQLKPIFNEMGKRPNYFPNAWDLDKAPSDVRGKFGLDNPYTKTRSIPTRAQGVDLGLKPIHENPEDALQAYANFKNISVANNNFFTKLQGLNDENKLPVLMDKKAKIIPANYKSGDTVSPLLNKWVISPETYKQLKFMKGMDKLPLETQAAFINSTLKKTVLSASLFHHVALTKSAIGLGVNPIKLLSLLPQSIKAGGAAYAFSELAKDALQHNLKLSGVSDVEMGLIPKLSDKIDEGINYTLSQLSDTDKQANWAKALMTPAIKAEQLWDKGLWAHYQPLIKLMAYESNVNSSLKAYPNLDPHIIKRQVADMINNTAGGQPWDLLFNDPNWHRIGNHALMALDWTASNLRAAEGLFEGGPKGYTARKYYLRQILGLYGAAQLVNYLSTQHNLGKGHFTWNNDEGHKFDLMLYKDPNTKRNYYTPINKALTEPLDWLNDPAKKFAGKSSPALQLFVEQLTGHTMSGYDLDFNKPGNRLKSIEKKAMPFVASPYSPAMGLFQTSTGMSATKLKDALETAVYKNDQKRIDALLQQAQANGIDYGPKLLKRVQSDIKAKATSEEKMKEYSGFPMHAFVGDTFNTIKQKLGLGNNANNP